MVNSAWLAELRAIEAVHDHAPEVPFENARHLVLTFHDSTLEAIATGARFAGSYLSRAAAFQEMARLPCLG